MMDGRGSWIWIWPQVVPKSMQLKNRTCLNLHVQKCSWYFFGDQVWCWTESVKLFEMKKCPFSEAENQLRLLTSDVEVGV